MKCLFFARICKWLRYSSILTYKNTKLLEAVCWFYIYLICFLWHNKLLCIHSITKNYNFINIVKNFETSLPKVFEISSNFWQIKTFGGALAPPAPTQLNQPTTLCFYLFAVLETCAYRCSSNYSSHVRQARKLFANFNRKPISSNTTHRQSLNPQAMFTGEKLKLCIIQSVLFKNIEILVWQIKILGVSFAPQLLHHRFRIYVLQMMTFLRDFQIRNSPFASIVNCLEVKKKQLRLQICLTGMKLKD